MNVAVLRRWGSGLGLALVVGFALYSNGVKLSENYRLNRQIINLKQEVNQKKQRNQRLTLLTEYYQTTAFREIEARRRLSMKKPDEKVLTIKGMVASDSEEKLDLDIWDVKANPLKPPPDKASYQLWWDYFFNSNS